MTLIVDLDDFATYLNDPQAAQDNNGRTTMILTLAQTLCETIVSPLPAGAEIVVLDVAQRAYTNPTSVRNSSLGLYAEEQGPYSDGTPGVTSGGLWLTQGNIALLRQLSSSGSSGAFSVDMTPANAGTNLPWWDTGSVWTGP